MSQRITGGLFYLVVLALALWINAGFAQSVPTFEDGAWVLPAREANAAPAGQMGGYEAAIYDACARHGCDGAYLVSIATCESGMDPNAWHANPYGGADVGLFQINDATWGSIAYAGPYEQIEWAAQMIANGGAHHWLCA